MNSGVGKSAKDQSVVSFNSWAAFEGAFELGQPTSCRWRNQPLNAAFKGCSLWTGMQPRCVRLEAVLHRPISVWRQSTISLHSAASNWTHLLEQVEQKIHFKIKVLQHKTGETRQECNTNVAFYCNKKLCTINTQKCHFPQLIISHSCYSNPTITRE